MPTNKKENYIESVWLKLKTTKENFENLIGFIAEHYVILNLNQNESLSFSYTDIVLLPSELTIKLRLKKTEKDLQSPRVFKILNKETKVLIEKDFEEVLQILTLLGFEEEVFDFNTKMEMYNQNKAKAKKE